jgi:hypothetical protein
MAVKYSVEVRTAKQGAIEAAVGPSPAIRFFSGAAPATAPRATPPAALLAEGTLPADWLAAAAAGAVAKTGTWQLTGVAAGTIGHFRIYEAGSPTKVHMQGTVTATAGGGDMTVDNTNIAIAQVVTVSGFTLTAGNA